MERGILKGLFKELDKVEKEMISRGYKYPKGSHFFPSSVPYDKESKEEVVRYFKEEIQKLEIISRKLRFWLDEYIDCDLDSLKIALPSDRELNDSFQNLTIPQLYLFYQPINPTTGKVYDIRSMRDWFKENPGLQVVVKFGIRRYSRKDFERYLIQSGINYNKELTKSLFDYANSEEGKNLSPRVLVIQLKEMIREFNR